MTESRDFAVAVERDVPTEMRDGVLLRSDIYRPVGLSSCPVLLCRTPYDKGQDSYLQTARALASNGYVAIVQDIRGRGISDGEYFWQFQNNAETFDTQDGYDTVEWAADLPGSNGQVGTWGHSYPSWCIWRLAGMGPPSLKALFASGMSAGLLDLNFGIFETGRRLQWTYKMAVNARRRAGDAFGPRSEAEADARWYEVERGKWIWYLPLGDLPDDLFSTLTPLLKTYLREQNKEFWAFQEIYHKVNVPTCQLTGWYDRLIGTIDNFTGMVTAGPEILRSQHRLIIGPWGHNSNNLSRIQGPLDFGSDADTTYPQELTRWYDYRFKGIANGIESEPPVKLFIMGENRWRLEQELPLARTQYTEFFLHSDGAASTVRGDGVLCVSEPGDEPPDRYDYDPKDPVMSLMGIDAQAAPRDQSPLNGRRDILVYQTPLLQEILK